jgi:hypothetical protein
MNDDRLTMMGNLGSSQRVCVHALDGRDPGDEGFDPQVAGTVDHPFRTVDAAWAIIPKIGVFRKFVYGIPFLGNRLFWRAIRDRSRDLSSVAQEKTVIAGVGDLSDDALEAAVTSNNPWLLGADPRLHVPCRKCGWSIAEVWLQAFAHCGWKEPGQMVAAAQYAQQCLHRGRHQYQQVSGRET